MSHSGSCASYSSEIRLNGQINQKLHWLNQKINYRDYTTMTVNKRLPMNGRLNGGTVNRCQPYCLPAALSSSVNVTMLNNRQSEVTGTQCARTNFRVARTSFSYWRTIAIGHECYCSRGRPMRAR